MQFRPRRPASVLASLIAVGGVALAVAGCSHIAPLGPDAGPSMPPARHLGSPIIFQVMRSQSPSPANGCPAGSLEVFVAPSILPHATTVHVQQAPAQAAASAPSGTTPSVPQNTPAPPSPFPCYRPVGMPVTVSSAAVSSVVAYPVPPNQPKGPAPYGFTVAVPAANVAAVTALIAEAYNSGDALGISVAGKLWAAPRVLRAFSGQQLDIAVLTRNQAMKLYRLLIPSG